MKDKFTYNCKQNDAQITLYLEDYQIDELHIGIQGDRQLTVIGYKDLQEALSSLPKMPLTREDIEPLGFKPRKKSIWVGWYDYEINLPDYFPYFTTATLHFPRNPSIEDSIRILAHRSIEAFVNNQGELLQNGESIQLFYGNIETKEELEVLMNQLNII